MVTIQVLTKIYCDVSHAGGKKHANENDTIDRPILLTCLRRKSRKNSNRSLNYVALCCGDNLVARKFPEAWIPNWNNYKLNLLAERNFSRSGKNCAPQVCLQTCKIVVAADIQNTGPEPHRLTLRYVCWKPNLLVELNISLCGKLESVKRVLGYSKKIVHLFVFHDFDVFYCNTTLKIK